MKYSVTFDVEIAADGRVSVQTVHECLPFAVVPDVIVACAQMILIAGSNVAGVAAAFPVDIARAHAVLAIYGNPAKTVSADMRRADQ